MLRCYRTAHPALVSRVRAPTFHLCAAATAHARSYRTSATDAAMPTAATSVAVPSPSAGAAEASSQTYFDYLDRMWSSKWFGTVDENVTAAAAANTVNDPSWFVQAFTACQHTLGVEAGTVIFLVGAATRLCTLVFSLYGERAGERMRLALPELKKPQEDFNRVYYNDLASAMEVQVAASTLKSHRRAVFRKYDTSNWKCVASLGMAPVIMTGLYQVSAMCENAALDVGSSSFLWCSALTLPDPFMIFPIVTCAVTLLNFELSISPEIKTGWMRNIIWGARLGCLCVIPVFSSFRAGVCLYFIGMNVVGLLQPLLVRSVAFRRRFGFPDAAELSAVAPAPAHASTSPSSVRVKATHKESPKGSATERATSLRERIVAAVNPRDARGGGRPSSATQDVLQASMTVQFPYLSHLLNPQVEENEELFAKARSKQSKPDFSRRGPVTSVASSTTTAPPHPSTTGGRYVRGTNPLMRETPLHRHDDTDATIPTQTSAGHGGSQHAADAASNVTGSATPASGARRVPKNKGSSFASSGWKSAQLSFDESDFVPTYDHDNAAASTFTKRK